MNNFEFKEASNGEVFLLKDGIEARCGLKTPMFAGPDQFNRPNFLHFTCTTFCVHATFKKENPGMEFTSAEKAKYTITCGCKEIDFDVKKHNPESKLINP